MRVLLGIAATIVTLHAAAQPSAEAMAVEVTDNVATEYAECAAYFAIVQGAFQGSVKSVEAAKYKEASDKAANFSVLAAKKSRSEEMATRVTLARFEMSMKSMQKTIDNDYSNISLLMNRYSTPCVEAMTDSAALIKRWTDKVSAKYSAAVRSSR